MIRTWGSYQSKCRPMLLRLHPQKEYTVYNIIFSYKSNYETLRVSGNGYRMGLAVILNADIEDYGVTNGKFDGFKVPFQNHFN